MIQIKHTCTVDQRKQNLKDYRSSLKGNLSRDGTITAS